MQWIWFAIIVAIPFTLLWALILPGNKILPFAGIINIALIVPAYLVTRGNTLRMVILSIIGVPFFLVRGHAVRANDYRPQVGHSNHHSAAEPDWFEQLD